ncbi:MAG: alpha-amylase [Methanofollis sp.]|uniref:alpha-amylase n=1 Tax=Methanofollis sp. TaxID=2052835 RepID=UPI002603E660|nr:alpha-amylase [Methanofollis sp.]MDD4254573.1 alpha-amylase [Methanofollis sp.]
MAAICLGFEVHQPFRLNRDFVPAMARGRRDLKDCYFDPLNREILDRVAARCYIPATEIVLDALDGGMRCAFSLSGVLVEQLERWNPDALALFAEVAAHKNAEFLAQTYYHSLAGFFADTEELSLQMRMHADLMHDLFGRVPTVAENTEFALDDRIAAVVRDLGFSAVYTEGADRLLGGLDPNETYTCDGLPLLLRNCPLSDDIAFRFSWAGWDKHPLMAETYASWVARSSGRCAHVFIDYETFGEHHKEESGILDFLEALPASFDEAGVATLLPSEAAASPPAVELSLENMVSWADLEKDASAWLGNPVQQSAFFALEHSPARAARPDLWRYLGTSDHFYYLARKDGSCGEVHRYFCPEGNDGSHDTYMRVLSHLEGRCLGRGRRVVASLPPDRAFHFCFPGGQYAGVSAHSLREFEEALERAPRESVWWHLDRGDYPRWIEGSVGDRRLARAVSACATPDDVREAVRARRCLLCGD